MGRAHHVPPVRDGYNGQAEINSYMPEDNNGGRGGVVGEGQGLPEEDESRVAADVNGDDVLTSTLPAIQGDQRNPPPLPLLPLPPPPLVQQQQQPPVGTVVHWERFLPFRSLKVLLVENDDSTRQVVSALLRNCSYEVIAVPNGLEAWKILKDLSNHVDLVLTEVVMPGLSGIGLLCKIMSHKSCKNIPVIMMSSHDSMGIVFNCLSRGAVDFLVKPIRKNELKNLWQHVWRRCHSSSGSGSGSGSESGIQTQKSIKSKSSDNSDNSGSNDEDKDTSIGLNMRDGSDNGSGTQSSWTKRAAEVESSQPVSPWDQLTDHPDSTCAQVIHLKTESFCNEGISASARKDHLGKENLGNESMTKYLEVGIPREPDKQLDSYPSEKVAPMITTANVDKFAQIDSKKNKQQINEPHCSKATSKLCKAIDLNGAIADTVNPQMPNWTSDASNDLPMVLESKSKEINIEEVPSLELGIKRFTSDGEGVTAANVDRSILRRSELSAFSRYNASAASNLVPAGYGGTCSVQVDDSSEVQKIDPYHHPPLCKASLVNQAYNESSSYNDKGSTTKNAFIRPGPSTEKSATMLTVKATHSSAFHPLQQRNLLTKEVMQEKIDLATSVTISHPKGSCQVQVQHHHHHHHHHHIHSMQQQHPADHEFSLKSMALAAPQCGSSNVFNGSLECNAANYSINGSVSGSHHGSNTLNGSSAAMNIGGTNIENDSGLEGKSAAGGDNGSGLDNNQFSRREAALTKFRQKRKERCFEKKVRYLSRKRLAEQHPRLHGQFVQKAAREQKDQDSDC